MITEEQRKKLLGRTIRRVEVKPDWIRLTLDGGDLAEISVDGTELKIKENF